jgi:hypothetical protein
VDSPSAGIRGDRLEALPDDRQQLIGPEGLRDDLGRAEMPAHPEVVGIEMSAA